MKKRYLLCFVSIFFIFGFFITGFTPTFNQQRVVIPYAVQDSTWWTGIAVHNETDDTMYCYLSVYAEDGTFIDGGCFTVDPKAIYADALDNFVSKTVEGRVSVYIQTNNSSGWTTPFSVTMFMGNNKSGFGLQTFQSQDYSTTSLITCSI